jgi:CRISPR/Cas system endoribonuclease Cas6 (RAMP superfamily)
MKSISIVWNTPTITIPIGYHHQVQGLIYKLLQSGSNQNLHDASIDFGMRQYKLFTFSSLRGGKIIPAAKSIHFEHTAYLDIRSNRTEFCDALLSGLHNKTDLTLCHQQLSVRTVKEANPMIIKDHINIKMLSPLTLSQGCWSAGSISDTL